MPVYSNRFKVEVLDGNAALSRQYAEIQGSVSAAEAAAAEAAASAAAAEAAVETAISYVSQTYATQGEMLDSVDSYGPGEVLAVKNDGSSYVVTSDEGYHYITAGLIRLYEAGPVFTTRARLGEAVARGALATGAQVKAEGTTYVIDPAGTALADLGVSGVRRVDPADNLFLSVHFTEQGDNTLNFATSLDGVNFTALNTAMLPGGAAFSMEQRDPAITFFNGEWWLFGTGAAVGSHDFVVYKGKTFNSMSKHQVALGGGPYYSTTTPMPGGTSPADAIWAPEPFIEDGVLKIMISIRYGADYTDAFGNTANHMRTYLATCTNPDTLTFSAPTGIDFAPAYPPTVYQWRHDLTANGAPTLPLYHQTRTDGWMGPDCSLMEHLARAYPGDSIVIVPAGKGSSGFSDSEWTSGGAARVEFAARLNAAIAANPTATIEGMFWQQGEADRNNASYQTQLNDFISYVRTTWTALATRPIIMGEMGTFVAAGTTNINAVIATVAAGYANCGVASSAGLTDKGDALHFDSNSNRALGDRWYAAWLALRGTLPSTPATRIFVIAGQSNSVGQVDADTTYAANTSMIDASTVKIGSTYTVAVKDDNKKRIRVYTSTSLSGPWTFSQSIGDTTRSIEAPCLVKLTKRAVNSTAYSDAWRIYVDHNRTGPTNATPNVLVGQPLYLEAATSPSNDYGDLQTMFFNTAVRHGSVVNLADLPPEAADSVRAMGAVATAKRPALEKTTDLGSGAQTIRPQPGFTYYVQGAGISVDLTILDGPADQFFLAIFAGSPTTGLNVLASSRVPAGFLVGYGRGANSVVEMRRRGTSGQYYPVSLVRRSEFRAHKNGTNQAVTPATDTLVTWSTADRNYGGHFSTGTGRWTPPQGRADIRCQVTLSGLDASQNNQVNIQKNGVPIANFFAVGASGTQVTMAAQVIGDQASGTDYYEVHVVGNGATAKSALGNTGLSFFEGVAW